MSAFLWRKPWARATLLLTPPLAWFLVIYVAALVVLLITAFWTTNSFTNELVHAWNLQNFVQIFTTSAYLQVIARTVGMAAGVTVVDGLIALPFAYFMARVATTRTRRSEEHTSELQSRRDIVCRLLLEKKKSRPAASHEHRTSPS